MDMQQLKSFYTVVKLGNMTRAADSLFYTQSALSQHISKLETELNCSLFVRNGKSHFTLTPAGLEVYKFADQYFVSERNLLDNLESISNASSGAIYMAAPYAVIEFLLGSILEEYMREHPNLRLHITEATPQKCIDMCKNEEVDIIFVHDSTIPANIRRRAWKTGHYVFAVPKEHPLSQIASPGLQDFIKYPLNLPSRNAKFSAREKLDAICNEFGLSYQTALETSNIHLNMHYTMRGIGVSFLLAYDEVIERYEDRLKFYALPGTFPDERISIILSKSSSEKACLVELLENIVAH